MFMLTDDDFIDLNSKFYTTCKPMSRIFTLLTIPTALFAIIVLCYFGFFPLKVEIHSVVLIGFIYLIYLFFIRHNAYLPQGWVPQCPSHHRGRYRAVAIDVAGPN